MQRIGPSMARVPTGRQSLARDVNPWKNAHRQSSPAGATERISSETILASRWDLIQARRSPGISSLAIDGRPVGTVSRDWRDAARLAIIIKNL